MSPQRTVPQDNLRLDRILSAQPELGPSVPDGGYGWIILIVTLILKAFVPSVLASYGIFMLFLRLEGNYSNDVPQMWDTKLFPAPVCFVAFWCISEPWNRLLVSSSIWPGMTTACGLCIFSAGILFQWIGVINHSGSTIYMFSGALSGYGGSLVTTQADVMINQYFKKKLQMVKNIIVCSTSIGFIVTPIMLGFIVFKDGIPKGIQIYTAILLPLIVAALLYRKPAYLKASRRQYELMQSNPEDDEMIYPSNGAEVRSNSNTTTNVVLASTSGTSEINSNSKTKSRLNESFSAEFNEDLAPKTIDVQPKPIYIEVADNPTNTVSDTQDLFTQVPIATSLRDEINFLWKLSFYKCWFLIISMKYSGLIFWIFFPTYLYFEMDQLKVKQTTFLVGCMGLGSLFFGMFSAFMPVGGMKRQNTVAGFCFLGSLGFFIISDAGTEGWLLFGALLVTQSVTIYDVLHNSVCRYILDSDMDRAQTLLNTFVGVTVLALLIHDASYRNCFRMVSLMQLIAGSILLTNFLMKKIKYLFINRS